MNCDQKFENQDEKALQIMLKMGYQKGNGLGKNENGMVNPVKLTTQYNRRGFGHNPSNSFTRCWNTVDVSIKEELIWIESNNLEIHPLQEWMKRGPQLTSMHLETNFCDSNLLHQVWETKENIFSNLDQSVLIKARTRANSFEAIKSAFFMNRAALKMANIDAVCDFMFTSIDKNPLHKDGNCPYYFADVCAGPGGFSEYILWRKNWAFKGFGFTLKGVHDFTLQTSTCASDATFRAFYGSSNDGNVCNPENISDFAQKVLQETDNLGVHFMMSDGGFSVDGNECLQEVLSKQIYAAQCLVALEIVRRNGHFVTKVFDIYTKFSVGLIFLMYHCFEKISILKPNSSRPANSERYLICRTLKTSSCVEEIRSFLRLIVSELWMVRNVENNSDVNDIVEIVPFELLQTGEFYHFIKKYNEQFARKQIKNLEKLATFCKDPNLVDETQMELKNRCLSFWRIPNVKRGQNEPLSPDKLLFTKINKPDFLYAQPGEITNSENMNKFIVDPSDWIYVPLNSSHKNDNCYIFVGVNGSKVIKLRNHQWIKVRNLKLAKGTILYGELVTEYDKTPEGRKEVKCLQVIDALRLGEISLADLPFNERCSLISCYCKAVSFETIENAVRVQQKMFDSLENIVHQTLVYYNVLDDVHYSLLPHPTLKRYFYVNSLLLLKTGPNHLFNTSFVLRVQLFIDQFEMDERERSIYKVGYDDLLQYLKKFKIGLSN